MERKKHKGYGPKLRNYLEQQPDDIRTFSKRDSTDLPDPVKDPIISNNIACMEFDYTSDELYDD